ncbi:IS3 family transposase [Shigella dysenteriae]|uniref:IS3 family transposase n=1 Tax=Shigella dysenteriae TaxID=622 RepID=UPI00254105E0|nr:IS3 family transposase [Shigella dysenteriae]
MITDVWKYRGKSNEPSDRKQSDERLKLEIKVAHIRTRETYGTRRLQTELAENGIIVGRATGTSS